MKKADLILVAAVMIMAAVIFFIYRFFIFDFNNSQKYLLVTINNNLVEKYKLNEDGEYTIESDYGYNKICISSNSAYVVESDCDNKICINTGVIKNSGDTICCLPHKLLIYIE